MQHGLSPNFPKNCTISSKGSPVKDRETLKPSETAEHGEKQKQLLFPLRVFFT